jgi:hypothetical protein
MKQNLFAFSSMLAGVLLLALSSCGEQAPQSENQAPVLNNIDAYYNSAEADSIRVQLVTYIYKPPNKVPMSERFDPQYRGWFTEQMTKFQFLHFHVAEDGTHYFYMLRPARTVTNEKRGVAGRFKLDADKQVTEYFELFNTPMIPEETVISHGLAIFPELIETGNFASFKDNPEFIEFPNAQAQYDVEIYEWSYKIQ